MATPYSGIKNSKLHAMAEVFCSHCSQGDTICRTLFCEPDRQIVDITLTLLETFCSAVQIYFPACYTEYCPASISKRDTAPVGENINKSVTCKATSDWSTVTGMNQWCEDNCKDGNDHSACPEEYCECILVNGSEFDNVVQSNNLGDTCLEWEAALVWSSVAGMNTWCQNVCSVDASCDPSYCQCKVMSQESTSTTTTLSKLSSTSTPTTSSATPSTTISPVTSSPSSTTLSFSTASSTSASSITSSNTTMFTTSLSASTVTYPVTSSLTHSSSSVPSITTGSLKSSISSSSSTSLLTTTTNFQTSTMKSTTTSPSTTTNISGSSQLSQSFPTLSGVTSSTNSATSNSLPTTSESRSTSNSPIISYSTTFPSSTTVSTTQSSSSSESSTSSTKPSTTTFSSKDTSTSSFITNNPPPGPSSSLSSIISSSSVVTSAQGTSTASVSSITATSVKPTVNITDKDSLDIIENIVCDHSTSQHHNILSDVHCKQSEESGSQGHSGYNSGILDQVLNFAPRVLCAFTSATERSLTCPDMFCGDNPLSQEIIKSSLCTICEMYSDILASSCVATYCQ